MKAKENHTKVIESSTENHIEGEHIEVLTEALSEVIKDYLSKKH